MGISFTRLALAAAIAAALQPYTSASAQSGTNSPLPGAVVGISALTISPVEDAPRDRGWNYLMNRFVAAGIDREIVEEIFTDQRLNQRPELVFSLDPKEAHAGYRKMNTVHNRQNAIAFYQAHRDYFSGATTMYSVPEGVILAILQVETFCGKNTGSSRIFPGLLRLASAATPENINLNMIRHGGDRNPRIAHKVNTRAKYLEDTFLPHAIAAVKYAHIQGLDLYEMRGSASGAIGMPQFLPGNYFDFGVDADGDSVVDLFHGPDAIFSIARYLSEHGWTAETNSAKEKRAIIWEYNRSAPYIDTVLAMGAQLQREIDRLTTPRRPVKRVLHTNKEPSA